MYFSKNIILLILIFQLEVSFKWLWTFLQFCCASPLLESKGVSRYELVLNWKWFSDYHLKQGFDSLICIPCCILYHGIFVRYVIDFSGHQVVTM